MHQTVEQDIARLLKRGVAREQRLLQRERKAESRVNEVQALVSREEARLARAQSRLDKRLEDLASVTADLEVKREARSTGGHPSGGE